MAGVFISYRRTDSQALAGRLFDRLARHFGKAQVFRDIDTLDPGARVAEVIGERIGACDALVALIGAGWLDAKDAEGRRRLDLPGDYVRVEIAAALSQGKLVIPALIENTPMPSRQALPAKLAKLADRNALRISDARFDFDAGQLIAAIEKVLTPRADKGKSQGNTKPRRKAQSRPAVTALRGGIAVGGNLTATAAPGGVAVVSTGPVHIGITLEQYEERLRAREREIREEVASTNKADKERIALLESQLAAAQAQTNAPVQAIEKYKKLLTSASQSLGEIQPAAPSSELESARQALARGETAQAEKLFEQAHGQGQAHAAEAAYQLGQLAESRIDYSRADTYYAEAARLQPKNSMYLNAAAVMALTLARFSDAEPAFRNALAIDEATLGNDHPNVAIRLNNLAQLLQATNRLAEAEPLMRRALAIDEASFGSDHPNVARDLTNLAQLLHDTNQLAEAEPLMRRALAIGEASFGKNHPNVGILLNNLAQLLQATNRLAEAEPLMRRALTIDDANFGKRHPNVAIRLNNLAHLFLITHRLAEAEPLMRRALAIDEESFGKDHPHVAISLNNLAQLLQATNRQDEAEPLMRRALAIDEAAFGEDHTNVAIRLNNLMGLLLTTNRLAEAEPLIRRALAIDEASFGTDHPKVAIRLNNLAHLLQATNRLTEAELLMRRGLAIDEASFGKDHPKVAIRLNNLAQLLQATHRLVEAEPLMRRALAIDEASLGEAHPDVAIDLNNLGQLLQATNRLAEAEPLLKQALSILEESLGPDHPNVARVQKNYADLLTKKRQAAAK